ncbi:Domain of unknown function DUF1619 [Cinara cedri]|uniref:Uncharacterized protein n=1 Tax=Cinara cedri TaxID=506608 RepID=A0A5E4N958_9HEMI|nr:Domain of unknown function DUF1619 [Cinara cedri]
MAVALAAVVAVLVVEFGRAVDTVKKCEDGKTCDKTAGVVRYDVSGNDNGLALKEIVVIDTTPLNVTDDPTTTGMATSTSIVTVKTSASTLKTTIGITTKTSVSTPKTTTVTARTTVATTTNNTSGPTKTTTGTTNNITVISTTNNTSGPTKTTAGSTNKTTVISTTTVATSATTETIGETLTNNGEGGKLRFVPNKYCYCDIIYGGCDINCCCDTDCLSHDLKTFTLCADQVQFNLIRPESILFDSSLFYVVVDNVPSDYFYPERAVIQSESQVAILLRNTDVFTWHDNEKKNRPPSDPASPLGELVYNNYDLTFKSLRWMYTVGSDVNTSEIKTFSLKNSAFNSLCAVEQPVEYLMSKETRCQMFVSNLMDACNGNSSLSFKRYYGKNGLFKVVQPIYSNIHKTEKIGLTTIQATVHHRCVSVNGTPYDCRVLKTGSNNGSDPYRHPVYSAGVCRRVIETVEYSITHNGTSGVRGVDINFYHRDVPDSGRPVYLDQKFSVRFVWVNRLMTDQYERSGKPGYAVGNPILVTATIGDMDPTNRSRHRPKAFDFPRSGVHGMCNVNSSKPWRQPVKFLENVSIQCRVSVGVRRWSNGTEESRATSTGAYSRQTEICQNIQNETISTLGEYEGTLVASLGDPEVARWIPVVVVKPSSLSSPTTPLSDDLSCPSIINGMHVRVFYSYVGTFDSPQATVIGMLVNYTTSKIAVNLKQVTTNVPIRASVVFVDLTRPPVRTFAEPPTYEFRLPEDFYYPFWSSDNARSMAATVGSSNTGNSGPTLRNLCSRVEFSIFLLVNSYLLHTLL